MKVVILIVLHGFLAAFVQSSPYRSSDGESSLCNLLSKENCLHPAVVKKCPSKCDAGLHQLFYDAAHTTEKDTKDPEECKYIPVKDCNGRNYHNVQKLCPKLCKVQETVGDIRDHDTCKYIAPIDCLGSKSALYKKICPILCETSGMPGTRLVSSSEEALGKEIDAHKEVATLVSSVRESLNENEDPNESEKSSAEGELNATFYEAVKEAVEHELSAGTLDEGELVVSIVTAVKEAVKENKEAPAKVVESPACEYMSEKLCVGEQSEHIKKICPIMCTTDDLEEEDESDELIENVVSAVKKEIHGQVDALDEAVDNPACVVMSEKECDGEQAEAIKELCPAMCTAYETEKIVTTAPIEEEKLVTTAPIEEVTDYPSCVHLLMHDCWGNNAEVVKLNCPVLCAQDNSKKSRGRYRPPSWAWVSDEGIKNLITITATEGGEQAAAAGVVLDEAVTTFMEKKQDDSSCADIGVASCTYTRMKNICPVKCASVMSIDCAVIKSCDGVLVQMLCPQKCGAEGKSSLLKSRERRGFGSRRRGGFRSRNRSPSRYRHRNQSPPRVSRPHSPPRPAPPSVPHGPAAKPPTIVVAPKGPGLLAQAAATAGGVAIGSATGHVIGDAISNAIYGGGDDSGSSNSADNSAKAVPSIVAPVTTPPTTAAPSEVTPTADEQAITAKPDPCAEESKVYLKCIEIIPDCSSCNVFKEEADVFLKCIDIMPDCSSCDVFKESLKQCNVILQSFDNATEVEK